MEERKNEVLFSRTVKGSNRNYFFDVKRAKNNTKYLVINENSRTGDTYERGRVLVFENSVAEITRAMNEVLEFVRK